MCSVIICTQSSPSKPWPSPDSSTACVRKLCSGGSSPSGSKPRAALTSSEFLDPCLAAVGFLFLVVRQQTARVDHVIDLLVQRESRDRACEDSMSARKPASAVAARPLAALAETAASQSELPPARAASRSASIVREPMPRAGKFTTRANAVSSFRFAIRRRYASACLTSWRSKNRNPPYTRYACPR